EAQREVELLFATRPEARQRLELFRQALEPLEADRQEIEPPPGLAIRALARVAEYCCRDLPRAPSMPASRASTPGRDGGRGADVLVAAVLLRTVGMLIPPVISHLQNRQQIEACKNNLKEFGTALRVYSDNHHKAFPNVAEQRTKFAGVVVPVLLH